MEMESCSTGSPLRPMERAFTNSGMNNPFHKSRKFIGKLGKYCRFRKPLCRGPIGYYIENFVSRPRTRSRAAVRQT
jgi:hypothetical protein